MMMVCISEAEKTGHLGLAGEKMDFILHLFKDSVLNKDKMPMESQNAI
jgi:hypothetical protein